VHQVLDRVRQLQLNNAEHQRQQAIEHMLISNIGKSGSALTGHTLSQLGLSVTFSSDETKGFVDQYSGNDPVWRNFLNRLVGQYEFLTERNRTQRSVWLVNPRCPLKRHELRRRGRLQLGRDGQWFSEDTLSYHALRYNKIIGCYHREYPMGWAVIETHHESSDFNQQVVSMPDFSRQAFWRWSRAEHGGAWNIFSGRRNRLAQRYGQSDSLKWSTKGLGRYAQISSGRERKPVRIAIKVTQKLKSGDMIQSKAAAQTYFLPPKSQRVQTPLPSLFEPYWRATLIPNLGHP
jgi:hypothetical protein